MTPGTEEVRVERDGRAMTITLDRPGDQNRLTRDVLLTLQGLVDRLGADEDTQAVVITGSYNFTQAAQSKNAENVVVISGNRRVTDRFVDNFELQRGQSTPWR